MIAKTKNIPKLLKTLVSLSHSGCFWGRPGRHAHTCKESPPDNVHHVKWVLLLERQCTSDDIVKYLRAST